MAKWFKAISIGLTILTAIENVKAGLPAELSFEWKGKVYVLLLTQTKLF